jgi:rubrerythrin
MTLTLPVLDDDGDIAGEAPPLHSASRRRLVTTALAGGGTLLAGGVVLGALPRLAASAPSPAQDARILNFLLRLEYAQAAFYEQAARAGLRGELRELAEEAGQHERAHVRFLRNRLGQAAATEPRFNFEDAVGDRRRFLRTALALEENTLAAYIGQSANISRGLRTPAARIVSIEARHAAWIKDILGQLPAPRAYDPGKSAEQVARALARRGVEEFS